MNSNYFRAQPFLDLHHTDIQYITLPFISITLNRLIFFFTERQTSFLGYQQPGVSRRRAGPGIINLDQSCFSPALTEFQDSVLYCHSNAVWNLFCCAPLPRKHTPGEKNSKPGTLKNQIQFTKQQHAIKGNLEIKTRLRLYKEAFTAAEISIGQVPTHLSTHANFSQFASLLTTRGHNSIFISLHFPINKNSTSLLCKFSARCQPVVTAKIKSILLSQSCVFLQCCVSTARALNDKYFSGMEPVWLLAGCLGAGSRGFIELSMKIA